MLEVLILMAQATWKLNVTFAYLPLIFLTFIIVTETFKYSKIRRRIRRKVC